MPTEITAQNGAVIRENTSLTPTGGCPPTLKIRKSTRRHNTLRLTLTLSQPGTLTITGPGLKHTTHTMKAGTHTITIRLTHTQHNQRHHRLKIHATLTTNQHATTTTTTTTTIHA